MDLCSQDLNLSLSSSKAFKSGEILTFLQGLTRSRKAYSTLQCGIGPDDHVELNSDFLYGVYLVRMDRLGRLTRRF